MSKVLAEAEDRERRLKEATFEEVMPYRALCVALKMFVNITTVCSVWEGVHPPHVAPARNAAHLRRVCSAAVEHEVRRARQQGRHAGCEL